MGFVVLNTLRLYCFENSTMILGSWENLWPLDDHFFVSRNGNSTNIRSPRPHPSIWYLLFVYLLDLAIIYYVQRSFFFTLVSFPLPLSTVLLSNVKLNLPVSSGVKLPLKTRFWTSSTSSIGLLILFLLVRFWLLWPSFKDLTFVRFVPDLVVCLVTPTLSLSFYPLPVTI